MEDKKNDYTLKEEQIARFAKALDIRLGSLSCIFWQKEACYFGAIHEELPIAKATVSQHLKELKDAGLDTREIETSGRSIVSTGKLGDRPAVVREFLCGLREKEGDVLR